jgi:hypothetical protein
MFVRMKTGKYAGDVREVKFADGRELVALGRAEKIDFSGAAPPAKTEGGPAASPLPKAPARQLGHKRKLVN